MNDKILTILEFELLGRGGWTYDFWPLYVSYERDVGIWNAEILNFAKQMQLKGDRRLWSRGPTKCIMWTYIAPFSSGKFSITLPFVLPRCVNLRPKIIHFINIFTLNSCISCVINSFLSVYIRERMTTGWISWQGRFRNLNYLKY